jgi:LuxR family maltose regulon positive regulatory protein
MASELVLTKLRIPPPPRHLVSRSRLIGTLGEAIFDHKLTLVSAPAGYGKTTLLADWARRSDLPVAWLSLGSDDNEFERFLRYLLQAWEMARPGVRESPLGVLLGGITPDREAVLTAFVNLASELPGQTAFVLDDYHRIENATIHAALTFLIDHLPATVHIVLAGRGQPPLPLARYRARQEMAELVATDLQLAVEETDDFLNRQMGLDLPTPAITSLHEQLEGWVAGTQMAALSLRRQPWSGGCLVVSGRHRFIADYLSQDVLANLPGVQRDFLLRTSILDRLSASLCDAVTGATNGRAILEALERESLFIDALDNDREWYRYHRLFSDFLRAELLRHYPDEVAGLHQRAAGWYLEHDLPESAFEHALAGNDIDLVEEIIDRYESFKLHGGELHVLRDWLDAIPDGWYAERPLLGLPRAGLSAFSGAFEDCVRSIEDVDRKLIETRAAEWQRARVTAYRCFVACFANDLPEAERFAELALRDLREQDLAYRVDIYHALGDTYRQNRRWGDARSAYRRVLDLVHPPIDQLHAVHVFGALADLELQQGRLRIAADYWSKATTAIQNPGNWGRLPLPLIGWVYVRTGELFYERDDLAGALERASQGLERAELGGDIRSMIAGYLLTARIHLTAGDIASAATGIERIRPLVGDAAFVEWVNRFERLQLELWLAQDKLRTAVAWAETALREGMHAEWPDPAVGQLAIARVLTVQGDAPSTARALTLLGPLPRLAEADGRMGLQIEALALQALAHWRRGARAEALPPLEHALRLAEPEGYLRMFADLSPSIVRLLQEAHERGVMRAYVAAILTACSGRRQAPVGAGRALLEPLTDREMEILGLVAAGLTNREIADRINISPETVKKHAGNIFGKLGARTRTEAVALARSLDILG